MIINFEYGIFILCTSSQPPDPRWPITRQSFSFGASVLAARLACPSHVMHITLKHLWLEIVAKHTDRWFALMVCFGHLIGTHLTDQCVVMLDS
jgi:hypothetical protein